MHVVLNSTAKFPNSKSMPIPFYYKALYKAVGCGF